MLYTGRGGLGNMSRSRSRGPAPAVNTPPHVHSTGRGGSGNIYEGDAPPIESVLEDGNVHFSNSAVHSTGRGGLANMSHSPAPGVEQLHPPIHTAHHYESTGRGGAGNMRDQSASRDPASRSQSRGRVGDLLHRVTHPSEKSSREREGDNGSVQRGRTAGPSD
ncbi:hypothetical protein VNI00_001176 [Paramarasmius palmivorus]|uniref:Uncharacterized protein n=1 Tax=Paramarasmius palmivorus TaxID=297713 RepID=A0AAW0E9V1_9AGAR